MQEGERYIARRIRPIWPCPKCGRRCPICGKCIHFVACRSIRIALICVAFLACASIQPFGTPRARRNRQGGMFVLVTFGHGRCSPCPRHRNGYGRWERTGSDGTADAEAEQEEVQDLDCECTYSRGARAFASWYRADAARLNEKQREREREAQEYFKNPSRHPIPKWPAYGQHCKDLAAYFEAQARKELTLADLHELMAEKAGKSGRK
jgi:hypothetical protein